MNGLGYWKDQDPKKRAQLDALDHVDQERKEALLQEEQARTRAPLNETLTHPTA